MKVNLVGFNHSAGRGVGFYTEHLSKALQAKGIEITDKNPDLVHYPFFDLFYPTLKTHNCPTLITIHDLTPLVLPKLYPQGLRARLNLYLQRLAVSSKAIITDSHASKKDLIRYFHLTDDQITVIPLAIDPVYYSITPQPPRCHSRYPCHSRVGGNLSKNKSWIPASAGMTTKKFILYVGGANPNKNLISLVKACEVNNIPLVLVGSEFIKPPKKTFSLKGLFGIQATHPENMAHDYLAPKIKSGEIIALGFVPTEQLKEIYKKATVYVQPSYYEGFGLSLLEAMASKCLTLSSNQGSLSELATDQSLIFDPYDQLSFNTTLKKALALTSAARQKIIESQFKKSKEYSWEKAVDQTIAVYKNVLK